MEAKGRVFLVQQEWRKKKKPQWSILQIVFGALAILGVTPVLAYGFLNWLLPSPVVTNWPYVFGGLGLTVLCLIVLKKV